MSADVALLSRTCQVTSQKAYWALHYLVFRLKNEAVSCWLAGVGLPKAKLTETDNPDLNLTGKIAPRERQSTSLSSTERDRLTDRK